MAESAPGDMLLYGCMSQTSKAGPSHAAAWTVRSVLAEAQHFHHWRLL